MGACIALRDDPLNADLPDNVGFSDYHTGRIAESNAEFLRLKEMDDAAKMEFGKASITATRNSLEDGLIKARSTRNRLTSMMAEVIAWKPPTPDHEGLKKFMVEQLQTTIDFDGDGSYYEHEIQRISLKRPMQVWQEALENAKNDVAYHKEEARKDVERNAARNEWVKQLKESVDAPQPPPAEGPQCATSVDPKE